VGRAEGQGVRREGLTDVVALMGRYLDAGQKAALCALSHGQVTLDGRTLGVADRRLPTDEIRGGMLCIAGRCSRVLGSRAVVNQPGTNPHFGPELAAEGRSLGLQSEGQLSF
jgi:hypothetical protein